MTVAEIEAAAFALPDETRAALGRRLLGDAADPAEVPFGVLRDDANGVREAEGRYDAYRRGATAAFTLEEVLERNREQIRRIEAGQSREEIKAWRASLPPAAHYHDERRAGTEGG